MKTPKSFKCKRCGACCRISPFLTENDIQRIKRLGFKEDYFVEELRGKKFMKLVDGKCVFLDDSKKLTFCKIHESRPKTCREYPVEVREDGDCGPESLSFDKRN